ncbi:phage tail tape measure protein [Microbacterium horticulturae]|uniref:Phage tail tape measure protein n=2 Tax=Microbacterium horticulturae TaxID=3028316 RepID=A0ABY8C2N4_9MICO|nr:phage tail tape measure protein [Microbacterium sp. KACC 23027]WEG10654.1 phage tail tape measure protein [Microbacterium sp. KACC 23027]
MSGVAATGDDARKNIDALTQASIEAGARTVFSAKESANAVEELAKAGLSSADILDGGLNGALDLAAAGGMGVADAAAAAATTLGQFQLKGKDASHVADLLAAGSGKAMGDVSDLSQALAQSGTVANQFGISVDDTVGSLAAFANAGMLGSDAGTSFKTMLLKLANPTGEAADEMKKLGIQAYDAQGQFVGMQNLAGQLQTSLGTLSQEQRNAALSIIFGQDAIRAANVLYTEGADGIAEWNAKVNDSGYAAETAATRLDNLKGDIEQLGGAVDSAFIGMGKAADGPMRFFVQALTNVVDVFNELPGGGQQAVFWVGGVGAAALAAGGAALLGVPKLAAYRAAVAALGTTGTRVTRVLTALGKGAGLAGALAVGLPLLVELSNKLEGTEEKARGAIAANKDLAGSIADLNDGFKGFDSGASMSQAIESLVEVQGNGWSRFSALWDKSMQAAIDLKARLGDLDNTLGEMASSNLPAAKAQFQKWAESTDGSQRELLALLDSLPKFKEAMQQAAVQAGGFATDADLVTAAMDSSATATDGSSESATKAADAYLSAQDAADQLNDTMSQLIDEVMKANGVGQDAVSQNLAYKDALAQVEEHVKSSKKAWGDNTQAGRDNKAMLVDLAKKSQDAAAAQHDLDNDTEKYRKTLERGREALIENAIKMGASRSEAKKLADQIYDIPSESEWKMIADTAGAQAALDAFKRRYDNAVIHIRVQTDGITTASSSVSRMLATSRADGGIHSYADGGIPEAIYSGGAPLYKFAEPETGWEAFISGRQSARDRNIGIWQETGRRLGITTTGDGDGSNVRPIQVIHKGDNYSYDPKDIAKQQRYELQQAMHAAGIRY